MRNKRVCDYIAEAIQNEILSGRMKSGEPLRQEELADSLGYSRIPIREALQILESQGLAKRLATRHVVVADFSDDVIEEIFGLFCDVELKILLHMKNKGIGIKTDNLGEPEFHEYIMENSANEYFLHILETGVNCYMRFALEETSAGKADSRKRRELLKELCKACENDEKNCVEKKLSEYFMCLSKAVIEERKQLVN